MKPLVFFQLLHAEYPHKAHDIEELPALGLYRNGRFVQCPSEHLGDEDETLKWFMDEDTFLVGGSIEKVNGRMLSHLYETNDDIVVLFYEADDRDIDEILQG